MHAAWAHKKFAVNAKKLHFWLPPETAMLWLKPKVVFHVSVALVTSFLCILIYFRFSTGISSFATRDRSSRYREVWQKMSADLEYNYKKALKRQKLTDKNVNELREKIKSLENVPKNLSSRKVWKFNWIIERALTRNFLWFSFCAF